ncbi:MAG: hypothetical protein WC763_07305 [Candidatus Paceibacterota bacterium]|jgi:hypothetical protein
MRHQISITLSSPELLSIRLLCTRQCRSLAALVRFLLLHELESNGIEVPSTKPSTVRKRQVDDESEDEETSQSENDDDEDFSSDPPDPIQTMLDEDRRERAKRKRAK